MTKFLQWMLENDVRSGFVSIFSQERKFYFPSENNSWDDEATKWYSIQELIDKYNSTTNDKVH